ncbi:MULTISPECIES: aldehyde dehydrogenase family protein [Actinomadura]|uniref:Aldehyde dehydrogenase family protein n=1 Tax=Actinomadura yumaensis TaxID=111807 RepID=A0ABW2CBZ0_9ACTN|nr:aldehyde dehydrogenase family protein [Actinomadura sp. J1-007]MWK38339.1 aldehyde dehydrogenase family protein [Actinomadura sp. J1-007]
MIPPGPRDLVAGDWEPVTTRAEPVLEDPATGAPVRPVAVSRPDRVERALAAASGGWEHTTAAERADVLDAVADALPPAAREIAALESFATGVPIRQTIPLGEIVVGAFRLAAQQLREGRLAERPGGGVEVRRLPWGPALCLTPWNASAPMAAHKTASALAAGCPVVLKPSEYAPYGTQLLAETIDAVLARHGAPRATFQLLHGDARTGATLAADARIRAVSFTGGAAGGAAVAAACAAGLKPAQLELGGNNPLVVLPDADVGLAARTAVDLLTTLNGQWCRALGRLVVPAGLHDELLAAVEARLARMCAGPPLEEETELGPLVHSRHRARVAGRRDRLLEQASGGRPVLATEVPDKGNYLAPALLVGVPPERAVEEIFGPVATVHPYGSIDEAVALANGTRHGLEGYVTGTDEDAALAVARRIRAGEVKVNGSSMMSLHLLAPRPAWGCSGLGEEGTVETLRFFTGAQVVGVENGFALHSREPA